MVQNDLERDFGMTRIGMQSDQIRAIPKSVSESIWKSFRTSFAQIDSDLKLALDTFRLKSPTDFKPNCIEQDCKLFSDWFKTIWKEISEWLGLEFNPTKSEIIYNLFPKKSGNPFKPRFVQIDYKSIRMFPRSK